MNSNPNYYAILPANVRYDNRLNANEKIMYAEITALTQSTGQCWASNKYFSDLYEVTPQAISKWIKNIEKLGYIKISYTYKKGTKMIERRYISLVSIDVSKVSTTVDGGINDSFKGYQHKIKGNTTRDNNTSINNYVDLDYKTIIDYLNEKTNASYKNVEGHRKLIRARYNEGYDLDDFKKVIDNKVNSWKNTEWEMYLRPSTLFSNKFDTYLNEKHFETKGVLNNEVTGDPDIFT